MEVKMEKKQYGWWGVLVAFVLWYCKIATMIIFWPVAIYYLIKNR